MFPITIVSIIFALFYFKFFYLSPKTVCHVCEGKLLERNAKVINERIYCNIHDKFGNSELIVIEQFVSNHETPEKGVFYYELKNHLWLDASIPIFIDNEYQIINEVINTVVTISCLESNYSEIKKRGIIPAFS
jgi:hypothetical protein